MDLDWPALVEDRNAWVAHNFPNHTLPPPGESVLGCLEEVGELAHADLKEKQSIRGDATKHQADARDAVGDLMVYLMGVMNSGNCLPDRHFSPIGELPTNRDESLFRLGGAVGGLCLAYILGWPFGNHVNLITWYARRYCMFRGWDFEVIFSETWAHVRERDWIKYPHTGLPPMSINQQADHLTAADKAAGMDGK